MCLKCDANRKRSEERETYALYMDRLVHRSGGRELVRRVAQPFVMYRHDLEHHEQYLEHILRSMLPIAQRECRYMRPSNPLSWSGVYSGTCPGSPSAAIWPCRSLTCARRQSTYLSVHLYTRQRRAGAAHRRTPPGTSPSAPMRNASSCRRRRSAVHPPCARSHPRRATARSHMLRRSSPRAAAPREQGRQAAQGKVGLV